MLLRQRRRPVKILRKKIVAEANQSHQPSPRSSAREMKTKSLHSKSHSNALRLIRTLLPRKTELTKKNQSQLAEPSEKRLARKKQPKSPNQLRFASQEGSPPLSRVIAERRAIYSRGLSD